MNVKHNYLMSFFCMFSVQWSAQHLYVHNRMYAYSYIFILLTEIDLSEYTTMQVGGFFVLKTLFCHLTFRIYSYKQNNYSDPLPLSPLSLTLSPTLDSTVVQTKKAHLNPIHSAQALKKKEKLAVCVFTADVGHHFEWQCFPYLNSSS